MKLRWALMQCKKGESGYSDRHLQREDGVKPHKKNSMWRQKQKSNWGSHKPRNANDFPPAPPQLPPEAGKSQEGIPPSQREYALADILISDIQVPELWDKFLLFKRKRKERRGEEKTQSGLQWGLWKREVIKVKIIKDSNDSDSWKRTQNKCNFKTF